MITSIIFTIIVIIASILCDLYIEEMRRITCKSCDSTNYFIVIQMMKFI